MGERKDSFKTRPTAEVHTSQILDTETFFHLFQTVEGLSDIDSNEILSEFVLKSNDLDDVLYISKFISNPETFCYIAKNTNNKNVAELSKNFYNVLTVPPIIYEVTPLILNEKGFFIAYIHNKSQTLHIAWKSESKPEHLFDSLLKFTKTCSDEYPNNLRSFGAIDIFLDNSNVVKVRFFGDASKKGGYEIPSYAPGLLKNFKKELEEILSNKFPDKKVEIEF